MDNCVLCKRENPPKLSHGLCNYCYQEYRSMVNVEQEPYGLAKRGDAQSYDLMNFLAFLRRHEISSYQHVWKYYACIRMLVHKRRLPDFPSRSEWLKWKAESVPPASRYSRAVAHYLAYKGFEPDQFDRKVWFEQVMIGKTPPQAEGVPERLRSLLGEYLVDFRTKESGQDSTLDLHGRNLISFFEWLGQHDLDNDLDAVLPEHISAYLAVFKTDGMTQGRKVVPGHFKAPWTMAKRMSVLRSFFGWAMQKHLCSENPVHAWQIDRRNRRTHPLPEEDVAQLVGKWTDPATPPREAMVGMMFLIYGLLPRQLLALNCDTVDLDTNRFHGLRVPVPIPPILRPILERYLVWREAKVDSIDEQSLVVSWQKGKFIRAKPTIFVPALQPYGVSPRQLRVTAMAGTIQHGSLKLLSVFGLTTDGMKRYRDLARLAENTLKVTPKPNLW